MGYTNSSMVVYKKLSPNHSGQRTHSIDRITPHCVVGQCSVETIGNIFLPTSKQASCNYGIGSDGRVCLIVEEKNRSWCSSSRENDQRAVTIECASDSTEPYAFKDIVYQTLIKLCVDICRRNGKKKLLWFGDKNKTLTYEPASDEMVLTVHRWFANKSCPGNWMYARMGDLASKVTAQLGGTPAATGTSSADTVTAKNTSFPSTPFTVNVIVDDLNYRSEGSMSGKVKGQTGKGIFTITEVKDGWGKLKSGAGWIYLENASYCTIGKTVSAGTESAGQSETKAETKSEANAEARAEGKTEEEVIWNTLFAAIGNAYGTAGLMGNLYAESALKANNLQNNGNSKLGMTDAEFTAAFDGGKYAENTFIHDGYGYGLAQWTYYTRKEALLQYAKSRGKSIGDLSMQLAFLVSEIKGYTAVWNTLISAKSVKEASDKVLTGYEKPADQSNAVKTRRAAYGQTYYDRYAKASVKTDTKTKTVYYRVRKSWSDKASQIGAFTVLENAKLCADQNPGFAVFDEDGNQVYPKAFATAAAGSFKVKVSIDDLIIRKGPGTDFSKTGKYTGKGIFTITEVLSGQGSTAGWGKLKSGAGYISLDFAVRV